MSIRASDNLGEDLRVAANETLEATMAAYDRLPAEVRRRLGQAAAPWSPIQIEGILTGRLSAVFAHPEVRAIVKGQKL